MVRRCDLPTPEVRRRLRAELGYITPKVGAEAAIFDRDGAMLLVRRSDDGRWCLPCGWVEPNETPAEAAVREAHEETGLVVRTTRLVDVFTRKPGQGFGPHSAVAVVYLCEVVDGTIQASHEVTEVRYCRIADVSDWHERHREYAEAAYAAWRANRVSRLLKKAHLPRWRACALAAAYPMYASLGASHAALHVDLFEQPGQ